MFGGIAFGGFRAPEMPQQVKDLIADKQKQVWRSRLLGVATYLPRFLANSTAHDEESRHALFAQQGLKVLDIYGANKELYIVDAPHGWVVEPASEREDNLVLKDPQNRVRAGIAFIGKGEGWSLQGVFNPLVQLTETVENGQRVRAILANNQSYYMFGVDPADTTAWDAGCAALNEALATMLPDYMDVAAYWDRPVEVMDAELRQVASTVQKLSL